jgi:hypothetical protein
MVNQIDRRNQAPFYLRSHVYWIAFIDLNPQRNSRWNSGHLRPGTEIRTGNYRGQEKKGTA